MTSYDGKSKPKLPLLESVYYVEAYVKRILESTCSRWLSTCSENYVVLGNKLELFFYYILAFLHRNFQG